MKIGMMITPNHAVPPQEHAILAPWWIVSDVANGVATRGKHTVYLYAASGSQTTGNFIDFHIGPTAAIKSQVTPDQYEAKKRIDERHLFEEMIRHGTREGIDVYHLHQAIYMEELVSGAPKNCRFLFTLHDPLQGKRRAAVELLATHRNCFFVSISKAQRSNLTVNFSGNVYNGIHVDQFPFVAEGGETLLSLGRIVPEKGHEDAIQAAKQTGKSLRIIGEHFLTPPRLLEYWQNSILPEINNTSISLVSVVPRQTLPSYLQDIKALIFPIKWEEAFGLVMIEAMASGIPVVAYARGATPEIIVDGVTGLLVNPSDDDIRGDFITKSTGVSGLVEAIEKMYQLSVEEYKKMRQASRERVEKYFTTNQMVEGYESVYERVGAEISL